MNKSNKKNRVHKYIYIYRCVVMLSLKPTIKMKMQKRSPVKSESKRYKM